MYLDVTAQLKNQFTVDGSLSPSFIAVSIVRSALFHCLCISYFVFFLYIIVMWSFRLVPASILSVYNAFVTLLLSLSLLGMCPVLFTLDSGLWEDLCWANHCCIHYGRNLQADLHFFIWRFLICPFLLFISTGGYDHCFAVANRSIWCCCIWSHCPTCTLSWRVLLLQRYWGNHMWHHTPQTILII